jgi:hypothetical protein
LGENDICVLATPDLLSFATILIFFVFDGAFLAAGNKVDSARTAVKSASTAPELVDDDAF